MRTKTVAQRSLFDRSINQLMRLIVPEEILQKMDAVIDANDYLLDCVYDQLTCDLSSTGARGMSGEQIFRVAILKQLKSYSWRELADRINDGICLRWFTRFYSSRIPHFTTLQKAVGSIKSETWEKVHNVLVQLAKEEKMGKGQYLRADTTVVETNIHYQTDARLLWDGIRVLTRTMGRIRQRLPLFDFGFADRTRCSKKLCYQITLVKGPKADKQRRKLYRRLIKVANEVFDMGCCCKFNSSYPDDLIVDGMLNQSYISHLKLIRY